LEGSGGVLFENGIVKYTNLTYSVNFAMSYNNAVESTPVVSEVEYSFTMLQRTS
jgi:hypothetical protein